MSPRQTTRALERWRRGERLRAERLNEPVDAINALVSGVSPGGQVIRPARGPAISIRRAVVRSVAGDHVVARFISAEGVVAAEDVLVAKPYLLRRSPFDGSSRAGVTYTYASDIERTAVSGADSETQVVVPSWEVDDELYCARLGADVVGVSVSGRELEWLDLNVDGRAWAEKAQ